MTPGSPRRWRRSWSAALGALALAVLLTVGPPPSLVEARRPWVPAPPTAPYTPRHVWQTKDNCVFASGQMLLDKWTHGRIRAGQARLRKASKVEEGGVGFDDLTRAVARTTGIRLRWSPGGRDPMTWWQLLDRLERQGGAVLFGEYHRLPASYTHWAPRFARSDADDHAVYIERYDRAKGRVWLMDPLAAGGFDGEWIDVGALRRFANFDGPLVYAAATPARARPTTAPLTDQAYRLGAPIAHGAIVAESAASISVPLTIVDDFPLPAAHRLRAVWERLDDVAAAPASDDANEAALSADRPAGIVVTDSANSRPTSQAFDFLLPAPARPGRYRLTLALVPAGARGDRPARTLAPQDVTVVGPLAGQLSVSAPPTTQVGSVLPVEITIANVGTVDWRPAPTADGMWPRLETEPGQPAQLTIRWRSATGETSLATEIDVPLAPGESTRVALDLAAPALAGAWMLEFDVAHPGGGSLAASGMTPTAVGVSVRPPGSEPQH